MLGSLLPMALVGLLQVTNVLAQDSPTCSLENKCPESAPCCSQYGQCGVGAFCLGGCDPRMSFSLDSCAPAPVCTDKTYKMNSMDRVVEMSKYLGDSSKADWVYQGKPLVHNNNMLLTMPPQSVGTVMASSTYMWYGTVKAKIKTARGKGVVTAFILYGDVKDEIDYEWVGVDLEIAQTNYYFQGIPRYDQSKNITVSDSFENWHEYEVRWTPDQIEWVVDGVVGRTKKRSDTWNETANQWDFPQTPARVQLSIWPGGAETNAKGTIDWAGGVIDWNSEDIKRDGYYYATFGEITVECFNADSPPGTNKKKSYIYNDYRATNDTVVDSDENTILASFAASGLNMDKGAENSDDSVSQVPGGTNPGSSGTGSHDDGSGSGGASSCDGGTDFSQSCSESDPSDGAAGKKGPASALAVIVALGALLWS